MSEASGGRIGAGCELRSIRPDTRAKMTPGRGVLHCACVYGLIRLLQTCIAIVQYPCVGFFALQV
jgi:hypothetical protein